MKPAQRVAVMLLAMFLCENMYGHEPKQAQQYKSENSLMFVWDGVSSNAAENQIKISDDQGHLITQLNVLRPVPEAQAVTIYDVSANEDLVAVAAVYKSKEGNQKFRPAASLLVFDIHGELLSVFALAASHAISRLVVDDKSHIWTLTDGAGAVADPSSVPLVVEYTPQGRIVREILTRDMFPFHALDTREDVVIGRAVMGGYSGIVWLWLPGSTDLVTISTNDGKATRMKTQLPTRQGRRQVVIGIFREPSGRLVGQFREDDAQLRTAVPPEVVHYVWSPATGSWSQFNPNGCENARLMGTSDKGLKFMRQGVNGFEPDNICTTGAQ